MRELSAEEIAAVTGAGFEPGPASMRPIVKGEPPVGLYPPGLFNFPDGGGDAPQPG